MNINGLDCPDGFGKIWVGNVSLNSLRQIYASVLRCCGISVRGNGRNMGYIETTRICYWTACAFQLLVVFVDREDNMEQVEKMPKNHNQLCV